MSFLFSNLQGLCGEDPSPRLSLIAQLMVEEGVSVGLLCEVMRSSTRLREAPLPSERRIGFRRQDSRERASERLARVMSHNMAVAKLRPMYYRSYPDPRYSPEHPECNQKGYGSLSDVDIKVSLKTDVFSKTVRAPLLWITGDGVHVYMVHAISDHGAARKQIRDELLPAMARRHGGAPWIIVGDLNCPPDFLMQKRPPDNLPLGRSQAIPWNGVYICLPEGPTRWASGNLLDYVISNIPCRLKRLPSHNAESRSEEACIGVLEAAGIDHRPVLVEYPKVNTSRRPPCLGSAKKRGPFKTRPSSIRRGQAARYRRVPVLGDGNCLFRAVAWHVGIDHGQLRAMAVAHIVRHWDTYAGFMEGESYLADLAGNGVWAGHIALEALSAELNTTIEIHRWDNTRNLIDRGDGRRGRIRLYYTGNHYEALTPVERPVSTDLPGKGLPRRFRGGSEGRTSFLDLVLDAVRREVLAQIRASEGSASKEYISELIFGVCSNVCHDRIWQRSRRERNITGLKHLILLLVRKAIKERMYPKSPGARKPG